MAWRKTSSPLPSGSSRFNRMVLGLSTSNVRTASDTEPATPTTMSGDDFFSIRIKSRRIGRESSTSSIRGVWLPTSGCARG